MNECCEEVVRGYCSTPEQTIAESRTIAFLECDDMDTVVNSLLATGRWELRGDQYTMNGGYRQQMVRRKSE
jgi:hypothetical protein